MSLLYGDGYEGQVSLSGKDYCFYKLFYNCSSLTTAPELPATTLAENCYNHMFGNCTSLTKAPELPATTLANECYKTMFIGCQNLRYVKCLATDISATDCLTDWLDGTMLLGTFITADNKPAYESGTSGIPARLSSLRTTTSCLLVVLYLVLIFG